MASLDPPAKRNCTANDKFVVSLLDYGAGNVRSVRNAILHLGFTVQDISSPEHINSAAVLVFPGVGSFGNAIKTLNDRGLIDALRAYVAAGRPYFGICLGMQTLFEGSEESPGVAGLGVIPGTVRHFRSGMEETESSRLTVPHIGWNGLKYGGPLASTLADGFNPEQKVYFVHSFRAVPDESNAEWILTKTTYGGQDFISSVQKGNVVATQFHPEKSGEVGLDVLRRFLSAQAEGTAPEVTKYQDVTAPTTLAKRVLACLDVRSNDAGDLVVTKGDQYDVREAAATDATGKGAVRNLGKPVALAKRYYDEGADEVVFLNITSFREEVLEDTPMLQVLEQASQHIFVPLTVGGGIRGYTDSSGKCWSALEVASRYFRAGADKVSLGTDAVLAAETLLASDKLTGESAIEQISHVYGRQAVVVSIDPRRVYVESPSAAPKHTVVKAPVPNESGQAYCWYQATIKGGREGRDIDAVALARACEKLGAGEIMLNCIDADGQGEGYETPLIQAVMDAITIPVIASSGAGAAKHFPQVFSETKTQAALAAGMFHRREVSISEVKSAMTSSSIPTRS